MKALITLFFAAAVLAIPALSGAEEGGPVNYSWAGKKMPGAVWGIASGDVDADGAAEVILLERRRLRIGALGADGFKEELSCSLPGLADGARVYAMDLDEKPGDEIVVSAVEDGLPASMVLRLEGKECKALVVGAPLSLRVAEDAQGERKLFAQGWSSDSFFFGPVSEISLKEGKLKETAKLALPWNTKLFRFTYLPVSDATRVALLPGYAPLEVRVATGKKFKRVWKSPARMGGSPNQLPASQRDVLGSEDSDSVIFDIPPVAASVTGRTAVLAVQSAVPAKGVIGRKPGISGSRVVGVVEDAALGFVPNLSTVELPSCISDMIPLETQGAAGRIVVVMQDECGMFDKPTESQLIAFDLPGLGVR